jgi:acyl-CoA thioester hydrolase
MREPVWRGGWYVVPWQVILRDLDPFGHVNNAVYLSYFELARISLWFALTGGSAPADIRFIMARAEIDYRAQLGMEPIEVAVRIGEMRTSSFDTFYEIRRADGVVAATGKVVLVHYDWTKRSKVAISDELRRKVELFQKAE